VVSIHGNGALELSPHVDSCATKFGGSCLATASSPSTFTQIPSEAQTDPSMDHHVSTRPFNQGHLDSLFSLYQKAGRPGPIPTFLGTSDFPKAKGRHGSTHDTQSRRFYRTCSDLQQSHTSSQVYYKMPAGRWCMDGKAKPQHHRSTNSDGETPHTRLRKSY